MTALAGLDRIGDQLVERRIIAESRYAGGRRREFGMLQGRGALVYPDGTVEWTDADWNGNFLTDEGEASLLDVYLKANTNPAKYLALNNQGGTTPSDTTTMAGAGANAWIETTTPGSNGYNRQQILTTDWGANTLDSGDYQSSAAEKTFGPNTGTAWTLSHVSMVTVATGTAGLLIAMIATTTTSVGALVSFRYTFRWKNQ